jgi:hypothetical protein
MKNDVKELQRMLPLEVVELDVAKVMKMWRCITILKRFWKSAPTWMSMSHHKKNRLNFSVLLQAMLL